MVIFLENKSLWKNTVSLPSFETLTNDGETDVLIIGGGITGILCAYELSKRNKNYILVEKDKIVSKTTGNTTAFITAFQETLYQDLIKEKGINKAKEYLDLNLEAIEYYEKLAKKFDFDFKLCDATLYSHKNEDIIKNEKKALEQLGYKAKEVKNVPLDVPITLGLTYERQAEINPLKLVKCLSENLNIYENTKIIKINNNIAITDKKYKIKFKYLIIATNYPILNKSTFSFMKINQKRSYVAYVKDINIDGTYCDIEDDGIYFRGYKNNIIIGGNDRFTKDHENYNFKDKVNEIVKGKEIIYYWSGQDCFSLDKVPYIGRYDLFHQNYFIATGFGLWGFTWAYLSSKIIIELMEGKKQNKLVNPRRFVINKQLADNMINAIQNLLTFKKPRCAHLGCALNYNKIDKTWECPCHGSRYDSDGNLLDGPAQKGINKKIT